MRQAAASSCAWRTPASTTRRSYAVVSRSRSSADGERRRARRARRQPARHGRRGAVEVAHEALLREWPRLRGWLEEDAEGRRLHQHLIYAARDWEASGRDRGELYRGARLVSALDWVAATNRSSTSANDNSCPRAEPSPKRRASAAPDEPAPACAGHRDRRATRGRGRGRRRRAPSAGEARDAAVVANAERLGAEALDRHRSTARCCSPARASRSTTRGDARQPAVRSGAQPGDARRPSTAAACSAWRSARTSERLPSATRAATYVL